MLYTIVEKADCSAQDMALAVNRVMRAGWRPIGGIAMTPDQDGCTIYAQAMVRAEPEPRSLFRRIEEAEYAMCGGNLDGESVPADIVKRWLNYIATGFRGHLVTERVNLPSE